MLSRIDLLGVITLNYGLREKWLDISVCDCVCECAYYCNQGKWQIMQIYNFEKDINLRQPIKTTMQSISQLINRVWLYLPTLPWWLCLRLRLVIARLIASAHVLLPLTFEYLCRPSWGGGCVRFSAMRLVCPSNDSNEHRICMLNLGRAHTSCSSLPLIDCLVMPVHPNCVV